jgi:c-di-GMP-binding flagellar brake protein YcgR
METNQPQAAVESDGSDHDPIPNNFGKRNPLEIGVALKNLMNRGDFVAVQYRGGQLVTRILDVDVASRQFVFDWGAMPEQNRALLASDRNLFTAQPEGVRLEFWSGLPSATEYEGRPAFVGAFPEVLYFMQRREYFRVSTPILDPFICRGKFEDGTEFHYEVHDISLGGVALRTADERAARLVLEEVVHGAELDLETHGMLSLDLQLVSRRTVELAKGGTRYQLGFRFVTLPGHAENTLQRIITQLEMKRRSLSRD